MHGSINNLKNAFKVIHDKGYIKSNSNSDGSVGTTFEALLGNKENNSSLPDYQGIELKCTASIRSYPITLFAVFKYKPAWYSSFFSSLLLLFSL